MEYLSKGAGIGGRLKARPEDFLVEEIGEDGKVYELDKDFEKEGAGRFTHFILQKKDWSTSSALLEIAKRLSIGHKHLSHAGTKDKAALTTQLVSVFDMPKERLLSLRIKDIRINGAWHAEDKVRLGQLLGNRFTIRVEGAEPSADRIGSIASELDGRFPNYFGEQRFGSTRRNTHLIGLRLLQGDLRGAADLFLCDCKGEENELTKEVRATLAGTADYAGALKSFPGYLRLERKMLAHLAKHPEDFKGALRALPRTTLLLFIHAFQSHLFNRQLSDRIEEGIELEEGEYFCGERMGFPDTGKAEPEGWVCAKLIGYSSPLNPREKALLEEAGVSKEMFRMRQLPEIASKGTYRTLLSPLKDFSYDGAFRFSLQAGSYATMAMREFMKG